MMSNMLCLDNEDDENDSECEEFCQHEVETEDSDDEID